MKSSIDIADDQVFCSAEGIYDKYADFYDVCAAAGRDDVTEYLALAKGCHIVIDVGCGTGRITTALLNDGLRVIGVDISQNMLSVCREKASASVASGALTLAKHDFCVDAMNVDADLAIVSWFTFNYVLEHGDQLAMLRNVHASLKPGSFVALDLFHPKSLMAPLKSWEERDVVIQDYPRLTRSDRRVMSGPIEERTQVYKYKGETFSFESKRRYVSPGEATSLLQSSGFLVEWISFDHGRTKLHPESLEVTPDRSFLIAARRGRGSEEISITASR